MSRVTSVWDAPSARLADSCVACNGSYPSIVRLYAWRSAGLVDVSAIILLYSVLASRLCARLVLPQPCELLSLPLMKSTLPASVEWDTYFDVTYRDDESQRRSPVWLRQTAINNSSAAGRTTNADGLLLRTVPAGKLATQLQRASALADAGTPFVWHVISDFQDPSWQALNLTSALLRYYRACTSARAAGDTSPDFREGPLSWELSSTVNALVASVQRTYNLHRHGYVTIHLRRGDALGVCDNSIDGIVKYATCSLANASAAQPLLFFTDEADSAYLASLAGNLTLAFSGRRPIVHGDAALETLAPEGTDTAAIFAASLGLRLGASAQLLMDRAHCAACEIPVQNESSIAGLIVNAQFHEAPKTSEVTSTYFLKTKGTDAQQPSCPDGAAAYATSGSAFRSALTNETMDAPSHGANPSAWLVLHEKSVEDWVESYPEPAPTATQALQP